VLHRRGRTIGGVGGAAHHGERLLPPESADHDQILEKPQFCVGFVRDRPRTAWYRANPSFV
jgi:hypothetical protein